MCLRRASFKEFHHLIKRERKSLNFSTRSFEMVFTSTLLNQVWTSLDKTSSSPTSFVLVNASVAWSKISSAAPSTSSSTSSFLSFCIQHVQKSSNRCWYQCHQIYCCHCYFHWHRIHGSFAICSGSSLMTCHLWQNGKSQTPHCFQLSFLLVILQVSCIINCNDLEDIIIFTCLNLQCGTLSLAHVFVWMTNCWWGN